MGPFRQGHCGGVEETKIGSKGNFRKPKESFQGNVQTSSPKEETNVVSIL